MSRLWFQLTGSMPVPENVKAAAAARGPNDIIEAVAQNSVNAKPGEQVALSSLQGIVGLAAAAYLLPVLFMIGCYFLPFPWEWARIAASFAGLAVGMLVCRWLTGLKEVNMRLEITRVLKEEDDLQ